MIKLSNYVMKFIKSLNINHVFLLPGGGCMHLVDSLGHSSLTPICCLHEQAATIAADAYSQYNQNIGVALVTTGPGSTNTITGVAGAYIDSTPLLIISGQVKTTDMIGNSGLRQKGIQEVDIVKLVTPITKYAETVTDPETIKYHLEKAVYFAKSGRPGPVWIDIPLDIQGSKIDEETLNGFQPVPKPLYSNTDYNNTIKIQQTIPLMEESVRPVLLIGNGARNSSNLLKLIDTLRIPVLTTWKALDLIPQDHKYFYGRPGIIGQRAANFIQQNADLIITIGARLDFGQIGYNYEWFAPKAKKVIVDIDYNELEKIKTYVDIPLNIDANTFIEKILNIVKKPLPHPTEWLHYCNRIYHKYFTDQIKSSSSYPYIDTYYFMFLLSKLTTSNDVIVPDSSGSAAEITAQSFQIKEGQRYIFNPSLGSMGYGLPAAIGAALASNKRVISIIGDGSIQHNIQELQTIKRLNLPIKIFVLNNNGYASIRNTHKTHFDGYLVCCDPSSGLTFPDTCKISTTYGLETFKLEKNTDIERVIQKTFEYSGPTLCEILIDPNQQTLPRLSSKVKLDGTIVSKPLEDLYPFLPRKEFNENMTIGDERHWNI